MNNIQQLLKKTFKKVPMPVKKKSIVDVGIGN